MSAAPPVIPPPGWRVALESAAVAALALWILTRLYDRPMVFNGDGVRDLLAAVDLRHGQAPANGPGVLPLRFALSPFYTDLLGVLLAVRPTLAALAGVEHACLAAGIGLLHATARRWLPFAGALLAALLAAHSATLVGAHQTFTHSGFMLPFELGAVLALFVSLRADRPWLLVAACAGLGAAMQLHTAMLPLLLLLAVPAWAHRHTRAFGWGWVALAVFALVAPMALYVRSEVVWGFRIAEATPGTLLDALLRQHSLPWVIAALAACARPAALGRRERPTLAALLALVALGPTLALRAHDRLPVALFNMHFDPFIGAEPTQLVAGSGWLGGARTLLWPLDGVAAPLRAGAALASVAGLALWIARRGATPKGAERTFLLAWAAVTVPPALWFLARIDSISVRYAFHASPVIALAAGTALTTAPQALDAWASASNPRLRRALDAARALGLPGLVVLALTVGPALRPRGPAPHDLMDGRVVESVWQTLVPVLGGPAAVAARSHGVVGQVAWGDATSTMWVFPPLLRRWPAPPAAAGSTTHARVFALYGHAPPAAAHRVPGTDLAYALYRDGLDGERAEARALEGDESSWAPLPLPARVVVRGRPYLFPWLHLTAGGQLPGQGGLALRVPRRANTPGEAGGLAVVAVSPMVQQPCVVAASVRGRALETREQDGILTTFAPPTPPWTGPVDVVIRQCTPVFVDVYDPLP